MQIGHHLTAITDPQRKAVFAMEEGLKRFPSARIEENALRPALTGAQHVPVGKAPAGSQALEVGQIDTAAQNVAHVDIDGIETGAMERG